MEAFTSFCPLCGGVQAVEFRDVGHQSSQPQIQTQPRPELRQKSWWQFWK